MLQLLKDRQLLLMIGALLVVDCATVVVWVFVDPLHRKLINFAHEVSKCIIIQNKLRRPRCKYKISSNNAK